MASHHNIHPRMFRDLEVQIGVSTEGVTEPGREVWVSIGVGCDKVTIYSLSLADVQDIASKIVGGLMELQRGPQREENDETRDLGEPPLHSGPGIPF